MSILQKHWFTEWCRASTCRQKSLYNVKIKNSSYHLIRKVCVMGSCQTPGSRHKFFKIINFARNLKFYHWQQIISFPWRERLTLFRFERKCPPNAQTSEWPVIVPQQPLLSVKMVFHMEKSNQFCSKFNQSRAFPGEDPHTLVAEELYMNLHCVMQNTEKD